MPQATEDRPEISVSASSNRRQTTDFCICLKQPKTDHRFPYLPQATEDRPQFSTSASSNRRQTTDFHICLNFLPDTNFLRKNKDTKQKMSAHTACVGRIILLGVGLAHPTPAKSKQRRWNAGWQNKRLSV